MKIKNLKEYESLHITIDDYLHMYYNLKKGSFNNLTHKNIKTLFPYIKKVYLKDITREKLLTGEILLVKDNTNKILAYQNPFSEVRPDIISETDKQLEEVLEKCKNNDKISVIFTVEDNIDEIYEESLEELNLYELVKKKKELINNHDYKMARLVQKELYFKSRQEHGTKKSKIRKLENKQNKEW